MGITKIENVDLIICGKQASDGDTAQVGPSLAEKLGIPHTTYVRKVEAVSLKKDICGPIKNKCAITCRRMTEDGYEIIEMTLPAVITVVKEINEPRLPSLRGMLISRSTPVKIWNADDVTADKDKCGLKGSPTQVVRTFTPEHHVKCKMLDGTATEQACELASKLKLLLEDSECHQ
jgi:electron transfer flavoprotein beta subunit